MALAVTWAAGFVDTLGFLTLSHILAANMSGNTVRVGIHSAHLQWAEVFRRGWPVLMFIAGLILSAAVLEWAARRHFRSATAITLGMEAALLGTFIHFAAPHMINGSLQADYATFNLLVALLALAMGLQNASVTRIGALSFKTTHVTGTLTSLAEGAAEYLFWFHDRVRGRLSHRIWKVLRLSPRQQAAQKAVFMAGLWLAFALGAVACAYANDVWGVRCLLFPMGVAVVVALVDLRRPILAAPEFKREERKAA